MAISRKFYAHVLVLAALALSPSACFGQSAFNWTGFYLGGNLGANWTDYASHGFTETLSTSPLVTPGSVLVASTPDFDETGAGFSGGGQVGYNQQFGLFVIGFEGDFNGTSADATKSLFVPRPLGDLGFLVERKFETNWTASARLRAGFAYERFLFYGTGGGAFTDVNVRATQSYPTNGLFMSSNSGKTLPGWTVGAGAEWAVWKGVSVGLEYRHSGFGRETYGVSSFGPVLTTQSTSVATSNDQVTLRVNFLFNGFLGH